MSPRRRRVSAAPAAAASTACGDPVTGAAAGAGGTRLRSRWRQSSSGIRGCVTGSCAAGLSLWLAACVTTQTGPALPHSKPNLDAAARINTQLGAAYARKGLYQVAEERLKLAIKERPDYQPAHAVLAYVYSQRGQTDYARHEYRRALDLAPDNPDTQNGYGVFLCANGDPKQAQKYFMKAAGNRDYATPEAAWTNAGVCARSHGELKAAEGYLRKALAVNPNFPSALEQMTLLSFQRREYLHARAFFERYRQVATPGPGLLWTIAQTERALGHQQDAQAYEAQLIQQYPDSPEADRLEKNP